jgi:hypothetical protein
MPSVPQPETAERPDRWAFGDGGFAKLYGGRLAQSSLLDCDPVTRWVFLFMLALADALGRYRCASVAGLARAAAVSIEQARTAVRELEAPDADSTSPEHEGRRILRIAGGWQIVNYAKYREYRTPRQIAEANRKRDWRLNQRNSEKAEGRGQILSRTSADVTGHVPQSRERQNPLIDRPALEAQALSLVQQLAQLTGEDPADLMIEASSFEGPKGKVRGRSNPYNLRDERLKLTVKDLEDSLRDAKAAKSGPRAVSRA